MHLKYERSAESLLTDSEKPRLQLLLPAPAEDEAPDDRQYSTHTTEKKEEVLSKAEDDIAELFSEPSPETLESKKKAVKETVSAVVSIEQQVTQLAEQVKEKFPAKTKRDPTTIKNIEQLAKALKEDFGLSYQQMWDELNIKSWNDLTISPVEAYRNIAISY